MPVSPKPGWRMNDVRKCRCCGENFYPSKHVKYRQWMVQEFCPSQKCTGAQSSATSRKYRNTLA